MWQFCDLRKRFPLHCVKRHFVLAVVANFIYIYFVYMVCILVCGFVCVCETLEAVRQVCHWVIRAWHLVKFCTWLWTTTKNCCLKWCGRIQWSGQLSIWLQVKILKIIGQYKNKLGTQDSLIFLKKKHVCSYVYLCLSICVCTCICIHNTYMLSCLPHPHPSAPCQSHLWKNTMLQKRMKRRLWQCFVSVEKGEKRLKKIDWAIFQLHHLKDIYCDGGGVAVAARMYCLPQCMAAAWSVSPGPG